ncbi:voltage-gated purine nucleotide uniporter SLC17A9-like isoform X2 [Pungitius pungitius]|uniref:voltage-gated purine nucleotide uniporter SLC17A9-like isoform X2 n=1 Tax=Pungitius pungitius TaxID=134920 RepID=UPI002E10832D
MVLCARGRAGCRRGGAVLFYTDTGARMADRHTSGDGSNGFNGSPRDLKVEIDHGSTKRAREDKDLWPRPLARAWTLMLFIGTCLLYCARMAMPVCAVTMATSFHWSKIDAGLVLGGFFWGYCFTQILGGYASDKLGGERVLFISAASWALITAVTPLLAHLGSHIFALMTMARFLMGLLQGVFYPSLASLCSQRVSEGDRGFLMSVMNSGSNLGILLAGGMGSLLLDQYGWESMFYIIGVLAGLWAFVGWLCLLKGTEVTPQRMETSSDTQWSMSTTRWLSLFKESSVRAMVFTHMCMSSTFTTLMSWLPTYFKESYPDAMGSVYNVIPWLVAIPSALAGGYVSSFLINRGYSIVSVRKIMQAVSMGLSSVFMMLLSGDVPFTSALIFISAAIGLSTFSSSGVSVNVQDLCPSCAGAVYGFMNMLGAFIGVVLVSVSGYLVEVTSSWATVFSLLTLVNATGLGIFLIFGEARRVDL